MLDKKCKVNIYSCLPAGAGVFRLCLLLCGVSPQYIVFSITNILLISLPKKIPQSSPLAQAYFACAYYYVASRHNTFFSITNITLISLQKKIPPFFKSRIFILNLNIIKQKFSNTLQKLFYLMNY